MDPNQQNQPRPVRPVSAARGSADQDFDVPPEPQQQLEYDPFLDFKEEEIDHSGQSATDASTFHASTGSQSATSSAEKNQEYDPATDPMIEHMRNEVEHKWYGAIPDESIFHEVFQGMTAGTNKAFKDTQERSRDSTPFETRFPGYVRVQYGKDPRWHMTLRKRIDLFKLRRIPQGPRGSESRGVMMPYRRGNLALAKKRAQESRQRSRNVMRAMKREKDKGRARQLLMRSKALLQQRLATRPNPEVMQRYWRKKAKKNSWKGMEHRMVFQRSPYKVHSQNISMVKNHMHKRRRMAQLGFPSLWNVNDFASKRDIRPIPVQRETGYDISRVRSLPPTLNILPETEIYYPEDQLNIGEPYFPKKFRGFPRRRIPKPFLIPVPRLTTPPASPRPSSPSSSEDSDVTHHLSDSSFEGSNSGSSTESFSDEDMQIDDTDADTEMED